MKTMILAAGLGTRLLPYTLKRPKPLFPILNKPLLKLTVSRLRESGFNEIIVNCHHLRQQIIDALKDEKGVLLQEEESTLGTGGGLRMAMPHLGHEPVLVVNGDIYHSIDYKEVYHFHCNSKTDVTLVLHDYPRFNDVSVGDGLGISGFNKAADNTLQNKNVLAFTGIHVINPKVLRNIPVNTNYCIIDCYKKFLEQGGTIKAFLANGHFWTDMGTPADYLKLHADLLKNKVPVYEELTDIAADAPFVGTEAADIADDAKLLDWACIGQGVTVESGATLQRTVVWDGAVITAESIIQDAIVTS